ncbi:MAG: hypothetical protein ACYTHK_02230 [Planctomycetota bacterium]|jgi:hypothetical protein
MGAALRLRLVELRRRGGLWFLVAATLAVFGVALFGGATVDGRYGVATDLAATLSYVAAVFVGAFPLAMDREQRRSYLPSASPVTPWGWALGTALAAAIPILLFAICLFAAAGVGAAMRGGIDTHRMSEFGRTGNLQLKAGPKPRAIQVPDGTTHIRFVPRTYLLEDRVAGSAEAALVEVDGKAFEVHHDRAITLPVRNNPVLLRNRSPEFAVALDLASFRALFEKRSFLPNALLASIPPALGAAALAALGAAASAHLGAPVAALLLTLLLLLASMRGFLLEMIEYEGSLRRAQQSSQAGHAHHGHSHGPSMELDSPGRAFAKGAVKGLLDFVPPITVLDRTGEVAIGRWVGDARVWPGGRYLLVSLLFAALVGGVGVSLRRTP